MIVVLWLIVVSVANGSGCLVVWLVWVVTVMVVVVLMVLMVVSPRVQVSQSFYNYIRTYIVTK